MVEEPFVEGYNIILLLRIMPFCIFVFVFRINVNISKINFSL